MPVVREFLSPGAERAGLSHEAPSLHPVPCGFHLLRAILSLEDLTREESFWESDLVCYSMVLAEKDVSFSYWLRSDAELFSPRFSGCPAAPDPSGCGVGVELHPRSLFSLLEPVCSWLIHWLSPSLFSSIRCPTKSSMISQVALICLNSKTNWYLD